MEYAQKLGLICYSVNLHTPHYAAFLKTRDHGPTMISPWILLGVFIFISYTTETITGFGSIVIAIALGALVLPIPEMLPVVVPLNILNSTYLSIKHRRHIHWPTLLRLILPAMTIGTVE